MNFAESFRKTAMSVFVAGVVSANAQAASTSDIQFNNLRIANRAQCAVDSDFPTETAFIVVDGYNAGKLANSLAKSVGADPVTMSTQGMQDFRIAVSRLTKDIMNKLFVGSLPLLPLNLKASKLANYNAVAVKCDKKTYCPELNSYLSKIWDNSEGAGVAWNKIDNFANSNFMQLKKNVDRVGCMYIKKFSGLQGHLHSTDLDAAVLQDMAQAFIKQDQNITSCEDRDGALDSRNSIIQMNLKIDNADLFTNYGFDFWNSVKIYLSFAWRYSNIPAQVSPQMGDLFKSIALEESVMMVSNGCKSIEKPSCDAETLSLNSIRELAKPGQNPTDSFKENPEGPEKGVINNGNRAVNEDFLGTRGYQEASDWVENFRKNYVLNRGSMKSRLQSAIQMMNVLSGAMTASELTEFVKPLALAGTYSSNHRDELYYLCTEARLAGDQRLDFMKTGIDKIKQMAVMQKAFESSQKSLDEMSTYFDAAETGVVSLCDALEKQNIWNVQGYKVNRDGFNSWAKEILNIPQTPEVTPQFAPMAFGAPLLVWDPAKGSQPSNVICMSGMDCARKMTKAMVDLYAVSKYADAFLPVSSTVSSPDIFNPYADLKACKIYDPWFQTRRANKRLLADLTSTVLFGWNAVPMYIDVDFTAPKVTSLKQLIENGSVKFDPAIQKSKMQYSVLADFGPLVGAPCAVSIAPNSDKAFNFYAFNGISLNYCKTKTDGTAIGESGGNVDNKVPSSRSYCGGCSINFVGVTSGAAMTAGNVLPVNPIKLGIYFFRSIYRFVEAKKDKVNIPRSSDVNLQRVAETYNKYGFIPDHCVEQLGAGVGCYQNICAAKAADFFERYTGKKVKDLSYEGPKGNTDSITKSVRIKSALCDGEIRLSFNCNDDGKKFSTYERFGGMYGLTKECRDAIGQNFWGR